mgnify:CR=1 FL=1
MEETAKKKKKEGAEMAGEDGVKTFGWAARDTSGILSPFEFTRRLNLIYLAFSGLVSISNEQTGSIGILLVQDLVKSFMLVSIYWKKY